MTYRLCLGLQHSDRAVLEHGIETGILKRLPNGEFIEVHQPLGPVDDHGHPVPLAYQGASVPKRMNQLGSAGIAVPGLLTPADETGTSPTTMNSIPYPRSRQPRSGSSAPPTHKLCPATILVAGQSRLCTSLAAQNSWCGLRVKAVGPGTYRVLTTTTPPQRSAMACDADFGCGPGDVEHRPVARDRSP